MKRSLGDLRLRGKESEVALYALTETSAPSHVQPRNEERIASHAVTP
jgi:hypothetical protein